jgi:hypothetical protein
MFANMLQRDVREKLKRRQFDLFLKRGQH